VHHVGMLCEDLGRSLDFYCGLLGSFSHCRPYDSHSSPSSLVLLRSCFVVGVAYFSEHISYLKGGMLLRTALILQSRSYVPLKTQPSVACHV